MITGDDRKYYSNKLLEIVHYFKDTRYSPLVEEASNAYLKEDWKKLKELFERLPNDYVLLETLVEKLKGKSVYTNLKKILTGEKMVEEDRAIAVSSLLTHTLIEARTNPEYKMLLSNLYDKLGVLIGMKNANRA